MKAGLLTEILTFKELISTKTETGFVRKEYQEILTCKASRRKMSAIADRGGVNAMEQFIGSIVVFQVRHRPQIKEGQRVVWRKQEYDVKMIDPQARDNSLVITLEKVNI